MKIFADKMIAILLCSLWFAVLCCAGAVPLLAQTNPPAKREADRFATPPLPKRRPNEFTSTPATPPVATEPALQTPPDPPPANRIELRARIRNCAIKWRDMKESGADIGTTWADFSQDCVAKN